MMQNYSLLSNSQTYFEFIKVEDIKKPDKMVYLIRFKYFQRIFNFLTQNKLHRILICARSLCPSHRIGG